MSASDIISQRSSGRLDGVNLVKVAKTQSEEWKDCQSMTLPLRLGGFARDPHDWSLTDH
ncbi:MAG: hypothetical protein ACK46A_12105 [Akkermansiaceae bacterium]